MALLGVLFVIVAVFVSLGYAAIGIARWARRTGRRVWLWLLGSYVLANIVWATLRPYLVQPYGATHACCDLREKEYRAERRR